MDNTDFIHYYQKELEWLKNTSESFIQTNQQDPNLERIIEALALLNTRTQLKMQQDFLVFNDALLDMLYPNYLAPLPAMSIAQFASELPKCIPANTCITTTNSHQFTTRYPVELWPITIENLECSTNTLQLTLRTTGDISQLKKLRFFINTQLQHAYQLYELIFKHTEKITSSDHNLNLQPVGFSSSEQMLPQDKRLAREYQLLTDFFAFPHKFLFFDVIGIHPTNNPLTIQFHFTKNIADFKPILTKNLFTLGCTPIINLFSVIAKPFNLDYTKTEYPLIPDTNANPAIYSVQRIISSDPQGNIIEYHQNLTNKHNYRINRKNSQLFVAFNNENLALDLPNKDVVITDLLCLNQNIPMHLTFTDKNIKCLTPTTKVHHKEKSQEKLLTHLRLNSASVIANNDINVLKEILSLYDFIDSTHTQMLRECLVKIEHRTIQTFPRGTEITLTIDEKKLSNNTSLYLFGDVLQRFFALHCTINTFTQLKMTNKQGQTIQFWPSNNIPP